MFLRPDVDLLIGDFQSIVASSLKTFSNLKNSVHARYGSIEEDGTAFGASTGAGTRIHAYPDPMWSRDDRVRETLVGFAALASWRDGSEPKCGLCE